jgi:hypothetical protein
MIPDEPLPDTNLEVFAPEETAIVKIEPAEELTPRSNDATHDGPWVVPRYAVKQVIKSHYYRPVVGHLGRDETLGLIDRNYGCSQLRQDVRCVPESQTVQMTPISYSTPRVGHHPLD